MSRSCQRLTFSIAATAVSPRTREKAGDPLAGDRVALVGHRGRNPFCSLRENILRLEDLGPLEMPDLRGELFERAPRKASTVMYSACLSRWSIWVDTGAGVRPSRAQTNSSTAGLRCSNVPTAPEICPTLILSTAERSRSMFRRVSSSQSASFKPNVVARRVSRASSPPSRYS